MGTLSTLTDISSLYSDLLLFILLTPRILRVHLHTTSKCSSLLLFCDPLWVSHWPQSSPSSFFPFFGCTPGFYTLVSDKHHLVVWCLFNGWTSVQVGSYVLGITQKSWTTFLGSSLNLSICCGCNTKSLELYAGFKLSGKINSSQAAPLPPSSSNSRGNTR